ncbi:hypothetical protein HK103_006949 [Boothiomyces macroporosus]|uniref:Zn(2)-C6 fungal-type domain-containing protein n=1 Tax=Boothiomyces macroporosus TaxID=261099 RepID=A0AAD5UL54_9FUNG|nr:hypothetical protein HK103_006949 [Boothiomyces macroporosus]
MRPRNTCIPCTKKKQKCDQAKPKCSRCVSAKIECSYDAFRQIPTVKSHVEKQLEARLLKLEAVLAAGTSNALPFEIVEHVPKAENIARITELNPNINNARLIQMVVEDVARYSFIDQGYMKGLLNSSQFLQYVFSGHGCFLNNTDIGNMEDRCDFRFVNGEYIGVNAAIISLFSYVIANPGMSKPAEGFAYFNASLSMAKGLSINTEVGIQLLTDSEYEKESIRAVWWLMYSFDTFFIFQNKSNIKDEDNGVFLPGCSSDANPINQKAHLSLQIMSSTEWFTPSLPNLSIHASKVLLMRLFGKSLKFNYLYQFHNQKIDPLYIMATLEGSLQIWWNNLPPIFLSHIEYLSNPGSFTITEPEITWSVFDTILQFYHVQIMVYNPIMLTQIVENPQEAIHSHCFNQSLLVAHHNARLLSVYLNSSSRMAFAHAIICLYIFHTAIPLICARKMNLPAFEISKAEESLAIYATTLEIATKTFYRDPILKETLDYLISLEEPSAIALYYTKFISLDTKKRRTLTQFADNFIGNQLFPEL